MKKFLLLFFLLPLLAAAQQVEVPRDTSFTVYSAYEKERKRYPFIQIAKLEPNKQVRLVRDVGYRTVNNRELRLDIFYHAKKIRKGYPGVLLVHGGGWRSGDKSQQWPLAQQLAARGYVAVAVEYRLSLEAPYPAALHDLKAAVRWMRAHSSALQLDPTKIAALGVSAGGQLAALLGTTNGQPKVEGNGGYANHDSAVQSIIDIDGVLAFKHPESEEGAVAAMWLGGTYEEAPEIWEEASPLSHVSKTSPPTLFINSSLPRFHAGRDDMLRKLEAHGIYSQVHTLPDTPHPFWLFHPWFQPTVDYTIDFLDKVFKGKGR
ncbi:hypothetical protein BH24BAC1_BH24BAC1_08110 [soil metagenome]